jgi:hypothetical protein
MRSPSQGRPLPFTDARDRALASPTSHPGAPSGVPHPHPRTSLGWSCPCCEREPREPVLLDGQLACRSCTAACAVCGSTCLPGDGACTECARHLYPRAVA